MRYEVIHGDCLQEMARMEVGSVDAVVTDPPYGMNNDCDYTRFAGGKKWSQIRGDDAPFDPTPWLEYPNVILWGYNHMARLLPVGIVLVWCKRGANPSPLTSDAELGWQKGGSGGVRVFHHMWDGFRRQSQRGPSLHPTEKPVALMKWCIERVTQPGDLVFDPYMGSGATGVAAIELGRRFVGCEIDEGYFETARQRIESADAQQRLVLEDT